MKISTTMGLISPLSTKFVYWFLLLITMHAHLWCTHIVRFPFHWYVPIYSHWCRALSISISYHQPVQCHIWFCTYIFLNLCIQIVFNPLAPLRQIAYLIYYTHSFGNFMIKYVHNWLNTSIFIYFMKPVFFKPDSNPEFSFCSMGCI